MSLHRLDKILKDIPGYTPVTSKAGTLNACLLLNF